MKEFGGKSAQNETFLQCVCVNLSFVLGSFVSSFCCILIGALFWKVFV